MPENNDYRGHGRYDESLARQVSLYGLISLEVLCVVHKYKEELVCTLKVQDFDNAVIICFRPFMSASNAHYSHFSKF